MNFHKNNLKIKMSSLNEIRDEIRDKLHRKWVDKKITTEFYLKKLSEVIAVYSPSSELNDKEKVNKLQGLLEELKDKPKISLNCGEGHRNATFYCSDIYNNKIQKM